VSRAACGSARLSSSCRPPPPVRHFPLLPVVFPSSTSSCFSSCPSSSSSCPPPSPVAGFPTPPLVIVVVGVLTQQRRWGVGVSCDFPVIVVVAVVVSPLLLLLLLLLVVVSPPFLLVVSPPFLLVVSLLWVVSLSFPLLLVSPASHRFPFPFLLVCPSCSPSFSSFVSFPPPPPSRRSRRFPRLLSYHG